VSPRVLLATTCRWFPTARLALALAHAGCTVDAVCPPRHPFAQTGALRQTHTYRGLAPLQSFSNAMAATQPDLVVPADDLATRHLHQVYRRRLRAGNAGAPACALIERSLGAPESFPVVSARSAFVQHAQEAGVRVPRTEVIGSMDDLKRWAARAGFPVMLKADGTSGGDGVRMVRTLEEAERALRTLESPPLWARAAKRALLDSDQTLVWPALLRRRSVVNAQAFVAGREATSTAFCWQGSVLASLHFEVVHKATATGHATVLRWIENGEMSAAAEAMVRRLSLSGLYGFDFMLEADTGRAYLIEVNPRATQVGHLALGPGRDLAAALYAVLSGKTVQPAPKITEKDTIALFPQEWIRDPASPFLRSAYHDIPWEEPELVRDCVRNRQKQSAWYSRPGPKPAAPAGRSNQPVTAPTKRRSLEAGLGNR
jgi:Carbamoyl-phosphate synthase L chain, ATP binding domain